MSDKVFKIAESLRERFQDYCGICNQLPEEVKSGIVFGFTDLLETNISYCLGCVSGDETDAPSGTACLGVYCLTATATDQQLIDLCVKYTKNKKSGKVVILTPNDGQNAELKTRFFDIKSKSFCECREEVVADNEAIAKTTVVALKADISLKFKATIDTFADNLAEELTKAKDGINLFGLELIQSSFKTNLSNSNDKPFTSTTLTDLYGYLEEDPDLFDGIEVPANMKKKMVDKMRKKKATDKTPLEFVANNGPKSDVTSSDIELTDDNKEVNLFLKINLLSRIQDNNSVTYLLNLFTKQLKQTLTSFGKHLIQYFELNKQVLAFEMFNYLPVNCAHFVSTLYPISLNEGELMARRKDLHLKYLISIDRPVFRKTNQYLLDTDRPKTDYLNTVHIGLKDSGLKDGQQFCVYGDYTYHHYMQDRMDDNGWGCAYRSLQTIVSWFRHQSYIDKPVPSHKDIQQALVDVGDKQSWFVGSRQWIGSQEVSYVLSHLYQIISKIMFVSSGAELANKGRELAHHFTTQGTPIMIGGGVLAHTIIGVDFSESTGELKFLILDPHYTGGEDLAVIQKKGWCGWKPTTFWDKNSFYNLCLPQRPETY